MSRQLIPPYPKDLIDTSSFDGTLRLLDASLYPRLFEVTEEMKIVASKDSTNAKEFELSTSDFYLEPQEEGGFVAYSRQYSGAVGQGETREEAIKDLEEAIQILKEVLEEDR